VLLMQPYPFKFFKINLHYPYSDINYFSEKIIRDFNIL
jgi:hypothetical protein